MWLMDFIYLYEIEKETSCNCFKWGMEGIEGGHSWGDVSNVQYKPIGNCHNESPCTVNIS
jgi:hypothetical protein